MFSRMRGHVLVVVLLAGVITLGWAAWAGMTGFNLAQIVPDTMDVWVEGNAFVLVSHSMWDAVMARVTDRGRLDNRILATLQKQLDHNQVDVSISDDVLSWAGDEFGFGMFNLDTAFGENAAPIGFLGVSEVKSRTEAIAHLPDLVRLIWTGNHEIIERTIDGRYYIFVKYVSEDREEPVATVCLTDDHLFVSNDRRMITECTWLANGIRHNSFSTTAAWAGLEQVSTDATFVRAVSPYGWLSDGLQAEAERLQEWDDRHEGMIQQEQEFYEMVDREILAPAQSGFTLLEAEPEGLRVETGLMLKKDAPKDTFIRRLAKLGVTSEAQTQARIPSDSLATMSIPSPKSQYDLVMDLVEDYEEAEAQIPEDERAALDEMFGWMTGNVYLVTVPADGARTEVPQAAMLLEGRDAQSVQENLPQVRDFVKSMAGFDPGTDTWEFEQRQVQGKSYEIIPEQYRDRCAPACPCIATDGSVLILSMTPHAMEASLVGERVAPVPPAPGQIISVSAKTRRIMDQMGVTVGELEIRDRVGAWMLNLARVPDSMSLAAAADKRRVGLVIRIPVDYDRLRTVGLDACDLAAGDTPSGYPTPEMEREAIPEPPPAPPPPPDGGQ